ncbi:CCA tRNA nucleotidyltransferase [Thermaerobacillus caldiproteolyticus]|uniref:CCA-adding enzyme n=1 Tax=Thermaerobacillus caldiproteolyticus TaxID=247480 RepID=A0A7V9Z6S1_9BACL|nr:CCA tRNA nucleotidyltransferase [Anoxybacillus caldiproteolyticus]MBA2875059.1 tRNA nucleotidyltransferase (CCA-adding enzyme) [Anoxybacillus caldiproteolyticus]
MKEPFQTALGIIRTLQQHGHEAYFVGGAVRDLLLNRPIGDVDIATSALPEEVMRLFPKTIAVGLEHGTVAVIHEGTPYEVTTFRTEGKYEDYRRPESVTFVRSLYEDLQRRDFTMNAIAMDEHGQLIDPFHGQEAISKRIIRTVGNAKERFSEDALRMMRALRFVSQLGFQLSEETKQAIIEHTSLLAHISVERITIEFEKLMEGPFAQQAFSLLVETQLFLYLPGLRAKEAELRTLIDYDWTALSSRGQRWGFLCYMLHLSDAHSFLRAWKLPNRLIKEVEAILHIMNIIQSYADWTKERLYEFGIEHSCAAEAIRSLISGESILENQNRLQQLFASLPIKERKELAINGKDLIEWYKRPSGPWIADMLAMVERAVINGVIDNKKEQIKEWLIPCNQKHEKNC